MVEEAARRAAIFAIATLSVTYITHVVLAPSIHPAHFDPPCPSCLVPNRTKDDSSGWEVQFNNHLVLFIFLAPKHFVLALK